jgi:hypothetical protein
MQNDFTEVLLLLFGDANYQLASFDEAFQIRSNRYAIDEASAPFMPEMKNGYSAWRPVSG